MVSCPVPGYQSLLGGGVCVCGAGAGAGAGADSASAICSLVKGASPVLSARNA